MEDGAGLEEVVHGVGPFDCVMPWSLSYTPTLSASYLTGVGVGLVYRILHNSVKHNVLCKPMRQVIIVVTLWAPECW